MISFIVFIFFIVFITSTYISTSSNLSIKVLFSKYMNYLSNAKLIYSNASILLYTGDKSGENFIFAVSNTSYPFSYKDICTLYEKAESLHIHNKILITDQTITTSSTLYKKLIEYDITIWNSKKLKSLMNDADSNLSYSSSPLKTSDTSDDTCDIDDTPYDPIQDGSFNTHGIFSIFNNKIERL